MRFLADAFQKVLSGLETQTHSSQFLILFFKVNSWCPCLQVVQRLTHASEAVELIGQKNKRKQKEITIPFFICSRYILCIYSLMPVLSFEIGYIIFRPDLQCLS